MEPQQPKTRVNKQLLATHSTSMLLKHSSNKHSQRSQKALCPTQASTWLQMEDFKHNNSALNSRLLPIHLASNINKMLSKPDTNKIIKEANKTKATTTKTTSNKINNNSSSSTITNNNSTAVASNTTKERSKHNSNNRTHSVGLITINNSSMEQLINNSHSIINKIISSNSNSKDLIISNSNSPINNNNRTIKVHRLICSECSMP